MAPVIDRVTNKLGDTEDLKQQILKQWLSEPVIENMVVSQGKYKDDELDGTWVEWDENGKQISKVRY